MNVKQNIWLEGKTMSLTPFLKVHRILLFCGHVHCADWLQPWQDLIIYYESQTELEWVFNPGKKQYPLY